MEVLGGSLWITEVRLTHFPSFQHLWRKSPSHNLQFLVLTLGFPGIAFLIFMASMKESTPCKFPCCSSEYIQTSLIYNFLGASAIESRRVQLLELGVQVNQAVLEVLSFQNQRHKWSFLNSCITYMSHPFHIKYNIPDIWLNHFNN